MEKKRVELKSWSERLVRDAGEAMKRARKRRGKTAEWLSGEVERLGGDGVSMSANTIAKIDGGHRGSVLNVTELLVLAAALNMPPALLLFPGYPDSEVEVLPGIKTTSKQAVEWFSGQARLPGSGGASNLGIKLVEAVRQHATEADSVVSVTALAKSLDMPEETVARMRREALDRMLDAGQRLTELQREMEGEN